MLHIYVKDLAGGLYLTEPNNDSSIISIKNLVQDIKKEYELDLQELFIPGDEEPIILDDYKTLSEYGLSHQSTIYVFIHPPLWQRMTEDIIKGNYIISRESDHTYGDKDVRNEILYKAYQNALLSAEDPDSQCIIGLAYFYGRRNETEPDQQKAVYWYQKAADHDHIASSYLLGECLYRGIGTLKNISQASDHIHFSAENDFAPAQLLLGQYYMEQMGGIYRDVAKLWIRRAAKHGNYDAQKLLKKM